MKSLQDALYNWLTIKVVCDARPHDTAAKQTETFFSQLLQNEYQIATITDEKKEGFYFVTFTQGNEVKKQRFPIDMIDVMLNQIELAPEKYRNLE